MTPRTTEADGLARLGPSARRIVVPFLRRFPEHNAYLLAQIERGALLRDDVAGPLLGFWRDGSLDAMAIFGSNLVVSTPATREAVGTFADYARGSNILARVVVGRDRTIELFMDRYGRGTRPVALERGGQRLFSVTADRLRGPPDYQSDLRTAELEELEEVMRVDRAMVVEELGFDPFENTGPSYREGWIRRLRERRAWVIGPVGGPLKFKVEQSAVSDAVIQLSGVYTARDRRREGLATAALARLCRQLLVDTPRISLYVHADNTAAVHLYQRLGFNEVGQVRAVWFVG